MEQCLSGELQEFSRAAAERNDWSKIEFLLQIKAFSSGIKFRKCNVFYMSISWDGKCLFLMTSNKHSLAACFRSSGFYSLQRGFIQKPTIVYNQIWVQLSLSWRNLLYPVACSWQLLSRQMPECQDKKLINIIQVLSVLTVVSSLPQVIFQLYFNWSKPVPACLASTGDTLSNIYFLCTGVSYFLSYLVKIVGIFMRGNDVQMEVLPADVNLDGHRSAHICFSSWNMAFARCLSLSLLSFFSVFFPHCCLSFRYSNKWKWRLWWLECLQPSFSLCQCFVWRAFQQHSTAASSRALQWLTASSGPASSCFQLYGSFWFDGTLSDNHDLLTKHEFLHDEFQFYGRQFTLVQVTGRLLLVQFADDLLLLNHSIEN